jgi:hypothetical protein
MPIIVKLVYVFTSMHHPIQQIYALIFSNLFQSFDYFQLVASHLSVVEKDWSNLLFLNDFDGDAYLHIDKSNLRWVDI